MNKTETFNALQDFESNFDLVSHPEEFLPNWSANDIRSTSSRIFQAAGEGISNSKALGIQPIGNFNAEIYTKTTTIDLVSNRISLKAKTIQNGSGNRPVYIFYSFSVDEGNTFTHRQQLGDVETFRNENSTFLEYDFIIPNELLEKERLLIKLEINYGEGNGSAARLFIDDFTVHGLVKAEQYSLEILSVEVGEGKNLVVNFNQPIKFTGENAENSISLNHSYGPPQKIAIEGQSLHLEFADYLYSNHYELTFNHLTSETGEEIWVDKNHIFEITTPTPSGAISINEFMPDPNPKGLVPEDPLIPSSTSNEYIELLNTSDKPIGLGGFSYNNGKFEDFSLAPGAYVLLTAPGNKELFTSFGQVIGVNTFSPLANTAGHISIADAFGNVVDSLSYTREWYQDQQKTMGGWALEKINPFQPCSYTANWTASTSPQGGTPGKVNAAFNESPDNKPFFTTYIQPVSGHEILVGFSKPINQESIDNATFLLDGKMLPVQDIHYQGIALTLPDTLISGHNYLLEVKNLHDCFGILISEEPLSFTYDIEAPKVLRAANLSPHELKVFFDEPINRSPAESEENYLINKENGMVGSANLADSLSVLLILKNQLDLGQDYSLTILNLEDWSGNISAEETVEFFLDDKLDTLILSGPTLLDLYFKTEVDNLSAAATINYSVDSDIGHPKSAFRNADNFKIVHLIFDQNLPQNTTGTLTTENIKDQSGNYINTHKKTFLQDDRTIAVGEVEVVNDSTLEVTFNKPLLPNFAVLKTNYTVNEDIGHPITVSQINPKSVNLIFGNKFEEGKAYQLSILGLRDIYGVEMSRTVNINFDFDLSAPVIEEALLINPYEIKVKSNKPILLPSVNSIAITHHQIERIAAINDREFILTTSHPLKENTIQLLLVGVADLRGNKADSIFVEIPNEKITLGATTIVKEDLIQLVFSAEVDPASAVHPDSYRVNGDLPLEVLLQERQFEILLQLPKVLSLGDSVLVEIKSIKSKEGKENQDLTDSLLYDDGIEDLYVVNSQLIQVVHKAALTKENSEQTIFSLRDQEIKIQPLVNQTDQRLLQLVLDKALNPDISYQLIIPQRIALSHQTMPGSMRNIIYDKSPPQLVMIKALNENELLVSFNEALDPILSLVTSFYHIDDKEPLEVMPGDLPNQVVLVLGGMLQKDKSYALTVIQLEDLHRNAISEQTLDFIFDGPVFPAYGEVIINELMAAPRSGNALPDAEYVELYNSGENEIFLGGLFLANSRSATVLPRESIAPGAYLILTSANRKEAMEGFGKTIGLSNWPTLLNDGDEVKLLDRNGNVLDELSYHTASYGGAEKAQGGYSLEIINPFSPCPESNNLRPSEAPQKGTPGKVNSVFDDTPDKTKPVLLKASPKGEKSIVLEFSKRLSPNLTLVELMAKPSLKTLGMAIDEDDPNRIIIQLGEPLQENQLYQISIENLRDCAGNLIDPARNEASFKIPVNAEVGDILLNEVLFHARTGAPKFVEIYNRSDKFIDLSNWKLANTSNGEVNNRKVIATDELIIDPFSYGVFTTDASLLNQGYPKGKAETYMELSHLPSYPNARGTVILLNPEEDLMERFDYDEKFHHALLNDVKGISLERYSLDHDVNDPENWHSASSAAGYATPGYKNSQTYVGGVLEKGITISPRAFVPDAPGEQNFTTISYEMNSPGFVATLRIYSVSGQLIKELCQNDIWGSSGFYTWDGTDLSGKKMRPGYYIVWVEVLNLGGRIENIRKTVVVGSKF
ncbi:MAG: lamin tail domain-containing protein [Anditalea sp.]